MGLYIACRCEFKVYSISLNLWNFIHYWFNTINPRPPSLYREAELLFLQGMELSVFIKTYRNCIFLRARSQASMWSIVFNYTDRSCTSNCQEAAVCFNHISTSSPSHPADHSCHLLCPDVWQLHAAHILLCLLTLLHLGKFVHSQDGLSWIGASPCSQITRVYFWVNGIAEWNIFARSMSLYIWIFYLFFLTGNCCIKGSICSSPETWHYQMGM